jgi:hypothetical protein
MDFIEIHRNSAESIRTEFKNRVVYFLQFQFFENQKNTIKLEKILMKIFFQINNICLVKIQIESNMQKWAHMAHHARRSYFFSTYRWHRSHVMPSSHSARAPKATVDANG